MHYNKAILTTVRRPLLLCCLLCVLTGCPGESPTGVNYRDKDGRIGIIGSHPGVPLCQIDTDGTIVRGQPYREHSCVEYKGMVALLVRERPYYRTAELAWFCWLMDPCAKEGTPSGTPP